MIFFLLNNLYPLIRMTFWSIILQVWLLDTDRIDGIWSMDEKLSCIISEQFHFMGLMLADKGKPSQQVDLTLSHSLECFQSLFAPS
jgi:hypothetical protein